MIEIMLKENNSVVVVSALEPTAKKALNNEVHKRVMTVLFIRPMGVANQVKHYFLSAWVLFI